MRKIFCTEARQKQHWPFNVYVLLCHLSEAESERLTLVWFNLQFVLYSAKSTRRQLKSIDKQIKDISNVVFRKCRCMCVRSQNASGSWSFPGEILDSLRSKHDRHVGPRQSSDENALRSEIDILKFKTNIIRWVYIHHSNNNHLYGKVLWMYSGPDDIIQQYPSAHRER